MILSSPEEKGCEEEGVQNSCPPKRQLRAKGNVDAVEVVAKWQSQAVSSSHARHSAYLRGRVMTDGSPPHPLSHKPIPRVDSFEIIEADCTPFLTDEEKSWPVVTIQPRVDGFDVSEADLLMNTIDPDIALRVTVSAGAAPDDLAVVLQKLRSAVEEARNATGGRVVIRLDQPSDAA
jgi:hypothetical protein